MPETFIAVLNMSYDIRTNKVTFKEGTNVKESARGEVLEEFIRSQIGAGEDHRPPDQRDVYDLRLSVNLDGDVFHLKHNCGNEGLALGIVLAIFHGLS